MANQDIIKKKVESYLNKKLQFTSVNVSNDIKKDGTWISNTEVSSWLRTNFHNMNSVLAMDYATIPISVSAGNTTAKATLYFHVMSDPDNYSDTCLKSMTPDEFKALQTKKTKKQVTKDTRVKIPAALVKQIGLYPGVKVNFRKVKVDTAKISSPLVVHADGRIMVPVKSICINGVYQTDSETVKAIVSGSEIIFINI